MHPHFIIQCPYFLPTSSYIPLCIPTSSHWAPHSTVHVIPPEILSHRAHLIVPCMSSLRASNPTKRTSSYRACHPTGHLIPQGILSHLTHLIPPGISFYRAHFIPPGPLSQRASYLTRHLIPPSAPHPTVNVIPPGISLLHSTERTSSYRACHPTVHVIPPSACHFAESILTKRVTHPCISLFITVFFTPLYISPYC